ncbi:MAG: TerB family tellurite resistance protein [Oscillatoriales cyanobacterium RM1_1_9]|nr:TerB family tellurite resistance protein [Oscillatoriales cyanobacterium RM1_1_9]
MPIYANPPTPSITPRQMNLLRVVTSMAWSDGHLAEEEIDVMLDELTRLFVTGTQQEQVRQELREYMIQNIPLEELIPKLETPEERELVLTLGYKVIKSSARTADEPDINADEAAAYAKLVQLLNLPEETVQRVEVALSSQPQHQSGLIEDLTQNSRTS